MSRTEECFGTVISITLYGSDEARLEKLVEDCLAECHRMETVFSAKLEDSELSRLNVAKDMEVSEELAGLIRRGAEYGELSDGTLDIALGSVIDLWKIGTEDERVPSQDEIDEVLAVSINSAICVDGNHVTINDSSVNIDLGAIAKGYAAQCIKDRIITEAPEVYGRLDFGGNIVTLGSKKGIAGNPWVIGIVDPLSPDRVGLSVEVENLCIVTSGNYERYFVQDGVRYHHILDPKTGYPADNGVISATIIGADSAECDALSTACYILGADRGVELIEGIEGVEAVFISEDGKITATSGMSQYDLTRR